MTSRLIQYAKRAGIGVARVTTPALRRVGIDLKRHYELAYWRTARRREGTLANDWYEAAFTERFDVTPEFYAGKRVLDVGCGPRGSLEWATQAARRVGLDPLVEDYRDLGIAGHEMEYVAAAAEAMPFPDASFDVVTTINSLDHVDDLDRTLSEITRVVAPGGELLALVHVHSRPTIAEPIHVPWDLASLLSESFETVDERHYEMSPDAASALAASRSRIPFDHTDPTERYGALVLRMRRR